MSNRNRYTWDGQGLTRPVDPTEQRAPERRYSSNQLTVAILGGVAAGWLAHELYTLNAILDALGL